MLFGILFIITMRVCSLEGLITTYLPLPYFGDVYWIADRLRQQSEVYRRVGADLELVTILLASYTLRSPLLPGFACPVARLFAA